MNNLNNTDDIVECPLCMEPLEVDDLNFFPCTCGYQICRFCWHRIRTDENQLCPACRKEYPENPADFKPLSQEEMVAFKFQKRQRDQKRKQEITENRKHLANVRVVQKNLVFVVGLPPRLADAEILKKHEYFGKYGKIHKVVINPSTTYAGVQGPSASAYVTYVHNPDALRAIQSVNNIMIDGRLIKTSLGTTKYCSHFMKNQQCPKSDCMYLHELGDPEASFTKEEMHQGKHQDYEKRLHEALIATAGNSSGGGLVTTTTSSSSSSSGGILSGNSKSTDSSYKPSGIVTSKSANAINNGHDITGTNAPVVNGGQQSTAEAWPSLSVSPVSKKENVNPANGGPKSKKERQKQEKAKPEKSSKTKNKNSNSNSTSNSNNNHTNNSSSNNTNPASKDSVEATHTNSHKSTAAAATESEKTRTTDKDRDRKQQQQHSHSSSSNSQQNQRKEEPQARTETVENSKTNSKTKTSTTQDSNSKSQAAANSERDRSKNECKQETVTAASATENTMFVSNSSNSSLSSSSSSSSSSSASSSSSSTASNGNLSSESNTPQQIQKSNSIDEAATTSSTTAVAATTSTTSPSAATTITTTDSVEKSASCPFTESIERTAANIPDNFSVFGNKNKSPLYNGINSLIEEADKTRNSIENTQSVTPPTTTVTDMPKLSLFDDSSFFSLNSGKIPQLPPLQQQQHQQTASLINNAAKLLDDPLLTGRTVPNLPDLINGIDGYQSNLNCSNDWEDAFKSVILKTNKQMEEKLQQQQQLQQHINNHHHLKQQEDLRKLQELQKRNILLNSMRVSQLGGPLGPLGTDLGRHSHFMAQQNPLLQHQQNPLSTENLLQNTAQLPFETNMSKFFDFHKHQQQQKLLHYGGGIGGGPSAGGLGSLSDNFHMMSLLENKPLNSQLLDPNSLLNSHLQQQQQKQKQQQQLYGKMDPMMHHQQLQAQQQQQQQALSKNLSNMHSNQNHLKSQYLQNSNADDDLGFDPFIETQKALAELIENEEEQQQLQQHNNVPTSHSNPIGPPKPPQQTQPTPPHQDHMLEYMQQRIRMPPPGFSHLNSSLGGYTAMDPRLHSNQNSKMLPFMNLPGTNNGGAGNPPHMAPQPQQTHPLQMPNPNVWGSHLGSMQQQQQQQGMGLRHDNLGQPQNMANQKPGYSSGGGSDWTAMDPAILSFRQFSFPQQQQQNQMGPPQMPPPQQQQQQPPPQDMFLQHLSQQAAGFGLGGGPPGGNGQMPNGQHHNSQGHLNVDANVQGMLEFLKTHQFV
ncbi:CCR4-NOT transcription complex subunit 4 [Musca autumnalis]|uniref:CCR4-NOT transcription complex subunit 4 n=1 Tax=Musca autumnalis TaxID=221902 RepID=UPI003CF6590F